MMDRSEFRSTIKLPRARCPVEYEVPEDDRQNLRLLSFESGRSMSDMFIEAITTRTSIVKAWVSQRKSA